MTPVGRVVDSGDTASPAGQRALKAQRIDGRVAVTDVPVDRVYLVERHIASQRQLEGLADEYAKRGETCGVPAVLAVLNTADDPRGVAPGLSRAQHAIRCLPRIHVPVRMYA